MTSDIYSYFHTRFKQEPIKWAPGLNHLFNIDHIHLHFTCHTIVLHFSSVYMQQTGLTTHSILLLKLRSVPCPERERPGFEISFMIDVTASSVTK